MNSKFLIIIFICLIFSGCFKQNETIHSFKIDSPYMNQINYEDEELLFKYSGDCSDAYWIVNGVKFSSENNFKKSLPSGNYSISLFYKDKEYAAINISIKKHDEIKSGENIIKNISPGDNYIYLNSGEYTLGVIRCDTGENEENINISRNKAGNKIFPQLVKKTNYTEMTTRTFVIQDIAAGNISTAKTITADLFYSGQKLNIFIDNSYSYNYEEIMEIAKKADTYIINRVETVFGTPVDVDNNKKVEVLMTGYLNDTKIAIGFFSPYDLFPKSNDNPISNECEIIYAALPDNNTISFDKKSIEATIAHEYQHLINFSQKSYREMAYGLENVPVEEVALNEGMSHLAEDICGYNLSGGNVQCVSKYLSTPSAISLFYGDDSLARRGFFYLFLRWLTDQNGSINYDDSGNVLPSNGALYLKNLSSSNFFGIENIETTFNQRIDKLFESFILSLIKNNFSKNGIDKFTGEDYGINLSETYMIKDKIIDLAGVQDIGDKFNIKGLSAGFYRLTVTTPKTIKINVNSNQDGLRKLIIYRNR